MQQSALPRVWQSNVPPLGCCHLPHHQHRPPGHTGRCHNCALQADGGLAQTSADTAASTGGQGRCDISLAIMAASDWMASPSNRRIKCGGSGKYPLRLAAVRPPAAPAAEAWRRRRLGWWRGDVEKGKSAGPAGPSSDPCHGGSGRRRLRGGAPRSGQQRPLCAAGSAAWGHACSDQAGAPGGCLLRVTFSVGSAASGDARTYHTSVWGVEVS